MFVCSRLCKRVRPCDSASAMENTPGYVPFDQGHVHPVVARIAADRDILVCHGVAMETTRPEQAVNPRMQPCYRLAGAGRGLPVKEQRKT
jgi:hypothetical protein